MDSSSPFFTSQEDFLLFHKMDRDLYRILVINLSRDPSESIHMLSMWLWLEKVGFRNIIKKIMSLPIILINEVADESLICLTCVNNLIAVSSSFSEANDIPLLQSLMDKEISLKFFDENRVEAKEGMSRIGQEICLRAFSDIMQQAMMRNAAERMVENNNFWFGSIAAPSQRLGAAVGNNIGVGAGVQVQQQGRVVVVVPADDRTLFVTFSKGYRVEEWEVREFFTMAYGDCIEALFMQEVAGNEQALFARIVFHKVNTIDMILRGASKVKFSINGKHVWARKFVPKRGNASTGETSTSASAFGSGFGM
ncbi:uncharacterized protein [Cicer arietinum]|uniref:Uncharacterized protein LOC101489950 n=1 Tax=Cicer arietinum TaxID=3827 RepID=A0A1S2Z902_CICAR|nr:uncharacterized protein LOC101508077 [Cicer arietinum]XP_004517210.1 uncharacterized protein LOC101489950 [Cicer arietinum]